jgi:hypothetical protein
VSPAGANSVAAGNRKNIAQPPQGRLTGTKSHRYRPAAPGCLEMSHLSGVVPRSCQRSTCPVRRLLIRQMLQNRAGTRREWAHQPAYLRTNQRVATTVRRSLAPHGSGDGHGVRVTGPRTSARRRGRFQDDPHLPRRHHWASCPRSWPPPGGPHQQSRQSRGSRPGRPGGSTGAEIPLIGGTATHAGAILPQIRPAG